MKYNVISSDDHVEEPKDTWQSRVPARLRDRAPKVVRVADGDAWEVNGVRGKTIGLEAQAGKKFEEYKPSGESYDTIRKGSYDPHERIKDMDIDGVDAAIDLVRRMRAIRTVSNVRLRAAQTGADRLTTAQIDRIIAKSRRERRTQTRRTGHL